MYRGDRCTTRYGSRDGPSTTEVGVSRLDQSGGEDRRSKEKGNREGRSADVTWTVESDGQVRGCCATL